VIKVVFLLFLSLLRGKVVGDDACTDLKIPSGRLRRHSSTCPFLLGRGFWHLCSLLGSRECFATTEQDGWWEGRKLSK
jgi:hypothetical protein